jgi:hypothetical protein
MSFQPTLALPRDTCTTDEPGLPWSGKVSGSSASGPAGLGPVLRERRSQPVDRRTEHAHVGVAPLALVAGVAAPLLGDADAAGERDPLVDDEHLAVGAVVLLERRAEPALPQRLAEPLDLHAAAGHVVEQLGLDEPAAHGVDEHAHPHPLAGRSARAFANSAAMSPFQ